MTRMRRAINLTILPPVKVIAMTMAGLVFLWIALAGGDTGKAEERLDCIADFKF